MSERMKDTRLIGGAQGRVKKLMRPQTVALLAIAVVFGLLLWAKLLLVTGHPRTALADPDEKLSERDVQADAAVAPEELTSR